MLKANILNGQDPDATEGIKTINKTIEHLERQTCVLHRYAEFAALTGETYIVPHNVAKWLDLAVEHLSLEGTREKLQYVNVREYNGRPMLAATDGYRLHAHNVADMPVGTYLMVDNLLRQVDVPFPDWTAIVPKAPQLVRVEEYEILNGIYAAWTLIDNTLVKFDPKRLFKRNDQYRLNERYYKDALAGGGEPLFYLSEATDSHPYSYQKKFMTMWPGAFAVVLPAQPEWP
jgi:hypothetical protein